MARRTRLRTVPVATALVFGSGLFLVTTAVFGQQTRTWWKTPAVTGNWYIDLSKNFLSGSFVDILGNNPNQALDMTPNGSGGYKGSYIMDLTGKRKKKCRFIFEGAATVIDPDTEDTVITISFKGPPKDRWESSFDFANCTVHNTTEDLGFRIIKTHE